jgi:hypothetical protein
LEWFYQAIKISLVKEGYNLKMSVSTFVSGFDSNKAEPIDQSKDSAISPYEEC